MNKAILIPLLDEYKEREKRLARGHEGVKGPQRRVLGVGARGWGIMRRARGVKGPLTEKGLFSFSAHCLRSLSYHR